MHISVKSIKSNPTTVKMYLLAWMNRDERQFLPYHQQMSEWDSTKWHFEWKMMKRSVNFLILKFIRVAWEMKTFLILSHTLKIWNLFSESLKSNDILINIILMNIIRLFLMRNVNIEPILGKTTFWKLTNFHLK